MVVALDTSQERSDRCAMGLMPTRMLQKAESAEANAVDVLTS